MQPSWKPARVLRLVAALLAAAAVSGARAAPPSGGSDARLAGAIKPPTRSANEAPEAYLTRVAEAADAFKLSPREKAAAISAYHEKCIRQRENPCPNAPLSRPQVAAVESSAARAEQRAAAARMVRLAESAAGGLRPGPASPGGVPSSPARPRPRPAAARGAAYAPAAQLPRGFVARSAAPPAPFRPAKDSSQPRGSWALLREAGAAASALWADGADPKVRSIARRGAARLQQQANGYTPAATPTAGGYGMNLLLKTASAGLRMEAFANDSRAGLRAAGRLAASAWSAATSGPNSDLAPKLASAREAFDRNPTKENRGAYAALQREAFGRELQYSADLTMPGGPLAGRLARSTAKGISKDFTNLWDAGATLVKHPEKRNGWYAADTAAKTVMPVLDVAGAATGVGGVVKEGGLLVAGKVATEAGADAALESFDAARAGDFKTLSDINESHSARVRRTEAELGRLQDRAQAASPGSSLEKNREYQATLARYKAERGELDLIRRDLGRSQMDGLVGTLGREGKIAAESDVDPKAFNSDFLNGRRGTPPFSEDTTMKKIRLEKDIELCQGQEFSAGRTSFGKWFIPCANDVYINDRALRDFIALPDSNGVDSIARVRIPAGTEVYVGTAGPIRSETAGRIETMYVNRGGEAVGGGGHGGYTQIYLDPKLQGKDSIADVGLTVVRVVPIPKSNSKMLLDLSKRWRDAYGDPERARAVYRDFLVQNAMPSAHSSAVLDEDFARFHRFFCASFLTENPGAAALPACRP